MAKKLLRATASFACQVKGRELLVRAGDVVASDHAAVKGRKQLFEAADRPSVQLAAGEEVTISH